MKILILHGPNLNLLGKRQPDVYGTTGFEEYLETLRTSFPTMQITYFQSNHEGELIDVIQQSVGIYDGVIFNAGGYSHTSVAIADAVASVSTPVIGIHISNIYARETQRHIDLLAKYCIGTISGLGLQGYELALSYFFKNK
ncbi:MAG: type II 3-dehydroquinate dehydratase [Bacteroidia bacterium]|nr:type II 3-dehydroquinate dehydratase [Bacteroidota bacterium]MCZ2130749.1 type II 3-dehydroquinate dehydratase [Bacteroidia bacterium]